MTTEAKKIITKDDMLAAARTKDIFSRQKRINDIVVGFADNKLCFDSTDALEIYYSVIHGLSGLSFNMKKTAYFNACENHMALLREEHKATAKQRNNEGR